MGRSMGGMIKGLRGVTPGVTWKFALSRPCWKGTNAANEDKYYLVFQYQTTNVDPTKRAIYHATYVEWDKHVMGQPNHTYMTELHPPRGFLHSKEDVVAAVSAHWKGQNN